MKVKNRVGGATRIPSHLPAEAIPIGLLGKIAVRHRGILKDDTAGTEKFSNPGAWILPAGPGLGGRQPSRSAETVVGNTALPVAPARRRRWFSPVGPLEAVAPPKLSVRRLLAPHIAPCGSHSTSCQREFRTPWRFYIWHCTPSSKVPEPNCHEQLAQVVV